MTTPSSHIGTTYAVWGLMSGGLLRDFVTGIAAAVVAFPLLATTVAGTHSLTTPRMSWDLGNNGSSDSDISFNRVGTWTSSQRTQLAEATNYWRGSSNYDPYVATGPALVPVTLGNSAQCVVPSGSLASACWWYTVRNNGTQYYDLERAEIVFDMSRPWNFNSSVDYSKWDFRGVLTHEIGHTVHLRDLYEGECNYGAGMYTMCGAWNMDDSAIARSLTLDDIGGANALYSP